MTYRRSSTIQQTSSTGIRITDRPNFQESTVPLALEASSRGARVTQGVSRRRRAVHRARLQLGCSLRVQSRLITMRWLLGDI